MAMQILRGVVCGIQNGAVSGKNCKVSTKCTYSETSIIINPQHMREVQYVSVCVCVCVCSLHQDLRLNGTMEMFSCNDYARTHMYYVGTRNNLVYICISRIE